MAKQDIKIEDIKNEEVAEGKEDVNPDDSDDQFSELEKARSEAAECNDKYLRLAAEFENYKRRINREQSTLLKYAEEELLRQLLPSIDNLERALEQGEKGGDVADFLEGVRMTYKGLVATLEKFDLQGIDSVKKPFDPNFHEALATEKNDEVPENHVLLEYEKGYMYKDRLLRAAKVVVSKGTD